MPTRILIDWDWAANGIWAIGATGTTAALFMPDWLDAARPEGSRRPNVWRDRLSLDLREALLEWNERGEQLFGTHIDEHTELAAKQAWRQRAAQLAAAVQQQLGPDCEVLYVLADGAWRWVTPPWQRAQEP